MLLALLILFFAASVIALLALARPRWPLPPEVLLCVAALFALLCVASCAGRDQLLSRTEAGLEAASKAFVSADAHRQGDIVAAATSEEDGAAKLAAYRAQRAKVVAAFETAYAAVAVAAITPDEPSVDAAVGAAFEAAKAVKEVIKP